VIVDIDPQSGKARAIRRLRLPVEAH